MNIKEPRVIDNDAIVVLAFPAEDIPLTHHGFRQYAKVMGYDLTRADCHNMLHRAMGRVAYAGAPTFNWRLTPMGIAYRNHVIATLRRLLDTAVTAQ